MTPEIAFRIGAAVTHQARKRVKHPPRVVLGKDTRVSGYLFESSLAAGVCAMGGRVMISGPLPTPAIAHLTTSMRADAGVVISASHNSFEDNGIKIFAFDDFKLPDAAELEIERLIEGGRSTKPVRAASTWASCVFRSHLGTGSGATWALIPGTSGHLFRSTWAPIPEHLGTHSGRIWAAG